MFQSFVLTKTTIGGANISKYLCAGIIKQITIMRDTRNCTYRNDQEFIKDKDRILNILAKDIDLELYQEYILGDRIIFKIKTNIFKNYFLSLSNMVCNNPICKFDVSLNFENYNTEKTNDIFHFEGIERIDKDITSPYYPVCLDTKICDIWISANSYKGRDVYNMLALLSAYSREYFLDNPLIKSLIYSVIL